MVTTGEVAAIVVVSAVAIALQRRRIERGLVRGTYMRNEQHGVSERATLALLHHLSVNRVAYPLRGEDETAASYASHLEYLASGISAPPAAKAHFPFPPLPWNVFAQAKKEGPLFHPPVHQTAFAAAALD